MIVGIGVDLCEIARIRDAIARHGESFAARILESKELDAYHALNPSRADFTDWQLTLAQQRLRRT